MESGMTINPARPAPATVAQLVLIGAVLLFPFLAYWATAASIVAIWDSSGTFAHGYVIVPISLWLIWGRREELKLLPRTPYWPALLLLAAAGLAWLLAEMGEVQIVRHYAFVSLLPLCVLAILGIHVARALAFPLLFLLFAVPFGDVFIAPLIDITANFTVDALVLTGIPVFREGNNFSIPSGNWSVVEACSGVRYLISSVTVGCLYAYLTYRTLWRRALFVLASILVPIVANGARAYMIVMIGHLSDMKLAVGVDHLIYGWVFFGLVMFLLFWIGSYWREDILPPKAPAAAPAPAPAGARGNFGLAALAIVAVVGMWPAYAWYLKFNALAPMPVVLGQVQASTLASTAFTDWKPAFPAASGELHQYFQRGPVPVGLSLLYYRRPPEGTKLITTTNHLTAGKDLGWHEVATARRVEAVGARALAVRETTMSNGFSRLLVWHWYWIDGETTANDYLGKVMQIRQKLLHASDDGAAVMLYAPYDEDREPARAAMRGFLAADLAAVEARLAANARGKTPAQ